MKEHIDSDVIPIRYCKYLGFGTLKVFDMPYLGIYRVQPQLLSLRSGLDPEFITLGHWCPMGETSSIFRIENSEHGQEDVAIRQLVLVMERCSQKTL